MVIQSSSKVTPQKLSLNLILQTLSIVYKLFAFDLDFNCTYY